MFNSQISKINNKKVVKIGRYTFYVSGWLQLAIFFLIIALGILFFLSIYNLLTSDQQRWYTALSLAYFIPPAGKETVIFIGLSQGLPVLYWCLTLWIFDVLVCLAIMTNWWFLELLIKHIPSFPFFGIRRKKPHLYRTVVSLKQWYEKLHQKTREIELKHYGKLLLIVLAIFMFVPFQGTGAMSTTIIGTFLGLRKHTTFLVVIIGSFLSILLLTFISIGIIRL
ncbi:MAG: small multi-drug export protein [Candidatus Thermoplasmatota archaeon]|nr:small multi-drug export protein [Candidatus Thermoplasmatota archaeon]